MAKFHYQSNAEGPNVELKQDPQRKEYIVLSIVDEKGTQIKIGLYKPDLMSIASEFLTDFAEELRPLYYPKSKQESEE